MYVAKAPATCYLGQVPAAEVERKDSKSTSGFYLPESSKEIVDVGAFVQLYRINYR